MIFIFYYSLFVLCVAGCHPRSPHLPSSCFGASGARHRLQLIEMAATKRKRAGSDIKSQDELVKILRPWLATKGKNFVKYSEEAEIKDSRLHNQEIADQQEMIQATAQLTRA